MSYFIELVRGSGSMSPSHRHLLILDGHILHVSVEVVQEARAAGLDLLTLPSHTSHVLQPLDVSIFKPFKQFFHQYRDFWMSRNLNEGASKEILAQWVSLSLKKALTEGNIQKRFSGTGIWPLNEHAIDSMLAPSQAFQFPVEELPESTGWSREAGLGSQLAAHAEGKEDLQQVHLAKAGQAAGCHTHRYMQGDHDQ
jgi:hypothetical protein